jgi:hypothetical protein
VGEHVTLPNPAEAIDTPFADVGDVEPRYCDRERPAAEELHDRLEPIDTAEAGQASITDEVRDIGIPRDDETAENVCRAG